MTTTPDAPSSTAPGVTGISHVTLTVRDLETSVGWYRDTLGLQELRRLPDQAGRGAKVLMADAGRHAVVVLVQHAAGEDAEFSEFRVGLDHLAFAVPDRSALDAWTAHLDAVGVPHSSVHDGLAVVRDPDGIQLEFYVS